MAGGTEVLREYLLSLGFKTNTSDAKRFTTMLGGIDKSATLAGSSLVGIATATVAMVNIFASQMEKLYYSSRRTGSTVSNLQAIEFGAKQIGLSGDQIRGSIESLARSLRTNPGLVGVIKSLGVKVEGRDMSDVAKDLVRQLRQLPYFVGAKFASMFGMDEETFLMLSQGLDKLDEASEKRKQMAKDAGVDADKAAEAAVRYRNLLSDAIEYAGLLKDALSIALLPTMEKGVELTNQILIGWTNIVATWKGWGDFRDKMARGLGLDPGKAKTDAAGAPSLMDITKKVWGNASITDVLRSQAFDKIRDIGHQPGYGRAQMVGGGRGFVNPSMGGTGGASNGGGAGASVADPKALFAALEAKWNLPKGLLDAVWAAESGRGRYMTSPKGARGHMGFMPDTAKEFGISGREDDLEAAAEAAARKWAGLLKQYGGNLMSAAAGYNYGQGKFSRVGNELGRTPLETRDYAAKIAGAVQQQNNWYITGVGVNETAQAVGQRLEVANSQLVSEFKGNTR